MIRPSPRIPVLKEGGCTERFTSMMNSRRLSAWLVVLGAFPALASRPASAQLFHHGQTQIQTTRIVTRTSGGHHHGTVAPVGTTLTLVPVGTMTQLSLVPSTAVQFGGGTTGFSPLQPVTLSNPLAGSAYQVQLSTGSNFSTGVAMMAQPASNLRAASGSGPMTDNDYQILAAGHGGSFTKVVGFESVLKQKLEDLISQKGSVLNEDELTTLLLDFAKSYLSSTGFGFLIDGAIEPILKRLIGKLLQDRKPSNGGNGPITPPNGNNTIPAGGGTFDVTGVVTGRIVLTPVGNTDPNKNPVVPPNTPKSLKNDGRRFRPSDPRPSCPGGTRAAWGSGRRPIPSRCP